MEFDFGRGEAGIRTQDSSLVIFITHNLEFTSSYLCNTDPMANEFRDTAHNLANVLHKLSVENFGLPCVI